LAPEAFGRLEIDSRQRAENLSLTDYENITLYLMQHNA